MIPKKYLNLVTHLLPKHKELHSSVIGSHGIENTHTTVSASTTSASTSTPD